MKIKKITPRHDWQKKCESLGFYFHSVDGGYWHEDYCYELEGKEIELLSSASRELHSMYISVASDIIRLGDYRYFNFTEKMILDIERTWRQKDTQINSIYSRFDFSYSDLQHPPKLLEYNADTPTTLLESAIVQKNWQLEVYPQYTQFNSVDEDLLARWTAWRLANPNASKVYFTSVHSEEDEPNAYYMQDIAQRAGLMAEFIFIEDISYSPEDHVFIDQKGEVIEYCFKLYPWEWLQTDDFFPNIQENITFLEPAWKLLLSNKAILVLLWEKYKNHPNLLPTYFTANELGRNHPEIEKIVEKQIYGREGCNMKIIERGHIIEQTLGQYSGPSIAQAYWPLPCLEGRWPMTGLWMVGDKPSSLGFRDDSVKITQNTSWFAPHYVR